MPRGLRRATWNTLLGIAAGIATAASLYSVWTRTQWNGIVAMGALLGLALIVQIYRMLRPKPIEPQVRP